MCNELVGLGAKRTFTLRSLGCDAIESRTVNRASISTALAALAAMAGIVAVITRPFLFGPIGLLCLLVASRLTSERPFTAPAAGLPALGSLAGAAVAVVFTKPLY